MAKPANSIATIKLPGDTDARPIIPYALGYNSSNGYQATLPQLSKDEVLGFAEDSVHTVTDLSTVAGSGTSGSYKSVR